MEFKFFTREREYKNPIKNGCAKIRFGIVLVAIGVFIISVEEIGINQDNAGNYITVSGKIIRASIYFLNISLGKWFYMFLFSMVEALFLYFGIKEIQNMP